MKQLTHHQNSNLTGPEEPTGFQGFQDLMRYRIRDIILVSSQYDLYVFEEDGRLYELIREEYRGLNLSDAPELTRVSSGHEALELAKEERRFDLIITTPHIEDMPVTKFARRVRDSDLDIPIVLLTYENRETPDMLLHYNAELFDRVFIWQGDFRILIGIIKHLEDSLNIENDTRKVGVQVIILIEDNIRFYSTYLPIIYMEIFNQSQRLISEGVSLSDQYLRMRARPKILLCTNYEDAWYNFEKYKNSIIGIISDIDFLHDGIQDPEAGIELARNVRKQQHDIPLLLQSNSLGFEGAAKDIGASFLMKESPTLLNDLRNFMVDNFGFGDFIFRDPKTDKEVGRAKDLISLETVLHTVPNESIQYHADHNHFSKWLKARTEFGLAHQLRPRKVSEFSSIDELTKFVIKSLRDFRKSRLRGTITDFRIDSFDPHSSFARIGGGSLGGKARGLSFLNLLIHSAKLHNRFKGMRVEVPAAVVLGTDVFDNFIENNDLKRFALSERDDKEIARKFLAAEWFDENIKTQLEHFLNIIRDPLAVRSSSLLEDSQYHPFAGVYETYMLPNEDADISACLEELINAIKCVYASTFYRGTKDYMKVTSYRLEEEKMAVIIQKMVGAKHQNRFYPDFSGVARSHNFYPVEPQKASDGITFMALGLGKTVVEGGNTVRFSPRYPNRPQFTTIDEALKNNQQNFFGLDLSMKLEKNVEDYDALLKSYPLETAEEDGTLFYVGSTYSHENHAIYDGLSRQGARLVTFSPILKNNMSPVPKILEELLEIGRKGMGMPVEIEFAVNMSVPHKQPKEFGVLQMRPLVLSREAAQLNVKEKDSDLLVCKSDRVLGNGLIDDIFDVVTVDFDQFQRAKTREAAAEVKYFNNKLTGEDRPYLLIGVGRWGSLDPWLGIPVKWDQISGAKAIIETGFRDLDVTPSQGSHFFQNITSFMIGYFTVSNFREESFVDWKWLVDQPVAEKLEHVRHLRFDDPLIIKMNGHNSKGIIYKPNQKV